MSGGAATFGFTGCGVAGREAAGAAAAGLTGAAGLAGAAAFTSTGPGFCTGFAGAGLAAAGFAAAGLTAAGATAFLSTAFADCWTVALIGFPTGLVAFGCGFADFAAGWAAALEAGFRAGAAFISTFFDGLAADAALALGALLAEDLAGAFFF